MFIEQPIYVELSLVASRVDSLTTFYKKVFYWFLSILSLCNFSSTTFDPVKYSQF